MKKILSILLTAVLIGGTILCFTGCGSTEAGKNGEVNVYNWGE